VKQATARSVYRSTLAADNIAALLRRTAVRYDIAVSLKRATEIKATVLRNWKYELLITSHEDSSCSQLLWFIRT
jgi:hypothetical protein